MSKLWYVKMYRQGGKGDGECRIGLVESEKIRDRVR